MSGSKVRSINEPISSFSLGINPARMSDDFPLPDAPKSRSILSCLKWLLNLVIHCSRPKNLGAS